MTPWWSIVSIEDVARVWADSDPWDPLDGENAARVVAAASWATGMVESYIGRNVIARKQQEWPYAKKFIVRHMPVVQVLSGGQMIDAYSIEADGEDQPVEYIGGYRRRDQTLADLQQHVPELTVLPAEVPPLIVETTALLAVLHLRNALKGTWTHEEVFTQLGTLNVRSRAARDVMDLLKLLDPERVL